MGARDTLADGLARYLARHSGLPVARAETHISWLLFCGPDAYKLKKPLKLAFLDFSTPALRQHFCEEELRLNRRLAPQIYLDVLPVTGAPEAPALGGSGPAIDHVLHMRRFADDALWSTRLAQGLLSADDLGRLGERLAAFHGGPRAAADGGHGQPADIAAATAKVLARSSPGPTALRRPGHCRHGSVQKKHDGCPGGAAAWPTASCANAMATCTWAIWCNCPRAPPPSTASSSTRPCAGSTP
jgi:hypothetical protein